jgi:hypothetical protein
MEIYSLPFVRLGDIDSSATSGVWPLEMAFERVFSIEGPSAAGARPVGFESIGEMCLQMALPIAWPPIDTDSVAGLRAPVAWLSEGRLQNLIRIDAVLSETLARL